MLYKNFLRPTLLGILLSLPLLSKADFCPTPLELQAGNYNQWQLLNINDATPLSDEATQDFQTNVRFFALAEWSADDGSGHCYYYGDPPDSDYLGAFLSKESSKPISPAWKPINEDIMQCSANIGVCLFETF